ncbi:MED6 mediator sub complex component-domain-containing protein [Chytridium lagenaria]|nr:MED6 mediator sub complex component-domain-containing protein [Chytridium lagenaria]
MSEEDLTQVCFKDATFLQMYGLNEHNVLNYFAMSPQFYDKTSINERLEMQTRFNQLQASEMDRNAMTGVDYSLESFSYNPSLFVIRKQYSIHPQKVLVPNIYQSPDLATILSNRVLTSLFHMKTAFTEFQKNVKYHPSFGHFLDEEKDEDEDEMDTTEPELEELTKLYWGRKGRNGVIVSYEPTLKTMESQFMANEFAMGVDDILMESRGLEPRQKALVMAPAAKKELSIEELQAASAARMEAQALEHSSKKEAFDVSSRLTAKKRKKSTMVSSDGSKGK